jgi:DNA-binding SARP family transcriptional activator
MTKVPDFTIDEAEQVAILEDLARNGSDTAKIQAIKLLRAIRGEDSGVSGEDEFARLYAVEGGKR